MSQDELPEELSDTERLLVTLAPRASRIDRDRLMIRLGEQSAAQGSNPWKWATAASLMLALALGLRPGFVSSGPDATEIAAHDKDQTLQTRHAEAARHEPTDVATRDDDRLFRDEADWLMALTSGRFDSSRPLSVRPGLETAWRGDARPADDASTAGPSAREPMLRWGDRSLREAIEFAAPPRT